MTHNMVFLDSVLFMVSATASYTVGRLIIVLADRRKKRQCQHQCCVDGMTVSYIRSALVDLGRHKISWCTSCGQHWFI